MQVHRIAATVEKSRTQRHLSPRPPAPVTARPAFHSQQSPPATSGLPCHSCSNFVRHSQPFRGRETRRILLLRQNCDVDQSDLAGQQPRSKNSFFQSRPTISFRFPRLAIENQSRYFPARNSPSEMVFQSRNESSDLPT